MKKIACIFLVILLLAGLTATVSARSGGDNARYEATITEDGGCQVRYTMSLTLDTAVKELYFPLPAGATDATVNGATAMIHAGKGISLSGLASKPGTYSITIAYLLPGAVSVVDNDLMLQLQLLSGFTYPIDNFAFTIRLPGDFPDEPSFTSGYHHETIIEHLNISLNGNTLSGYATGMLKDHETLDLTLPVSKEMFPRAAGTARMMQILEYVAYGLVALAILFYLFLMLPQLRRPSPRPAVPTGLGAGDVGLWLSGLSMDFSLMVVSWAQMGYLQIRHEANGRLMLYKRMDMGNERSAMENKIFFLLFQRRSAVDATSDYFARLYRKVGAKRHRRKEVFGNRGWFTYVIWTLCVLSAGVWGLILGAAYHPTSIFLWVVLSLAGIVMSVLLQRGGIYLLSRRRSPFWVAVGTAVVWLVLSLFCGKLLSGIVLLLLQCLLAMACLIGGSRTQMGRQTLLGLIDLWLHLLLSHRKQMQQLMKRNPDYFHDLAPYALALNVDRVFSRRFGKLQMPECYYLQTSHSRHLTAAQFSDLLRKTVNAMDAKAKRLPWDRLLGR